MLDWLRKLFGKKEVKTVISNEGSIKFEQPVTLSKDDKLHVKWTFTDGKITSAQVSRPRSVDDLRKLVQQRRIAKQNEERQKATLGYGLQSRNFKPRPSQEKKLWRLDKKPAKKLEEED